jgi:hypothetical protein
MPTSLESGGVSLTLLPTYPTICWASQRSQQIPGEVGARAESEYQRNQLEQESVMSKVLLEMSMSLDGYRSPGWST